VVIGYITHQLYITSFVKNNEFLAIIMSYFDKNSKFLDKNNMYFDKNDNLNLLYNGNDNKTCYITAKLVI
jgi:hypothetical protein